jgi:hypothetical protein
VLIIATWGTFLAFRKFADYRYREPACFDTGENGHWIQMMTGRPPMRSAPGCKPSPRKIGFGDGEALSFPRYCGLLGTAHRPKLGRSHTAEAWIQSRETLRDEDHCRRFFEIGRYSCKSCSDSLLRVPGTKGTSGLVPDLSRGERWLPFQRPGTFSRPFPWGSVFVADVIIGEPSADMVRFEAPARLVAPRDPSMVSSQAMGGSSWRKSCLAMKRLTLL